MPKTIQKGLWLLLGMSMVATGAMAAQADVRLVEAARQRDAKAVAELLQQNVDPNSVQPDGATALHWAAHWDELEVAGQLIAAGANVNATNDYGAMPLFLAATNGSGPMVDTLLDAGASPNSALPTGETVLMTAARTGKVGAVSALLARGADVNAVQASKGQNALIVGRVRAARGHRRRAARSGGPTCRPRRRPGSRRSSSRPARGTLTSYARCCRRAPM